MLKCTESEKLMAEAAESGFKVVDSGLFEHLKNCQRCAAELKALKRLRSAFESAPRYRAPYMTAERVMRRVHREARTPRRKAPLRNLAAGFALVFALGAGVLSGTFIASNIMGEAGNSAQITGTNGTLLAYSGDTLDPASPDLMAGDYLTAPEDTNDR